MFTAPVVTFPRKQAKKRPFHECTDRLVHAPRVLYILDASAAGRPCAPGGGGGGGGGRESVYGRFRLLPYALTALYTADAGLGIPSQNIAQLNVAGAIGDWLHSLQH